MCHVAITIRTLAARRIFLHGTFGRGRGCDRGLISWSSIFDRGLVSWSDIFNRGLIGWSDIFNRRSLGDHRRLRLVFFSGLA